VLPESADATARYPTVRVYPDGVAPPCGPARGNAAADAAPRMDPRVYSYLADSITAATTVAELDAMRELVTRATMDRLERRTLRCAIRLRADAILLANPAALE
jgi:hypothetical protein